MLKINKFNRNFLTFLIIFVSFFLLNNSYAYQSNGLTNSLTNLSRDVGQYIINLKNNNDSYDNISNEVFSKLESASLKEIYSFIETINNPAQFEYIVNTIKLFISENQKLPNIISSLKVLKLLDEKLKFLLAQSYDENYLKIQHEITALIKNLSSKQKKEKLIHDDLIRQDVNVYDVKETKTTNIKPGANYNPKTNTTTFGLLAPRATSVKLALFDSANAKEGKIFDMKRLNDGMWYISFNENLVGKYYGYYVDGPKGPGEKFNPNNLLSDPYAYANDGSYGKSIVIDTNFDFEVTDFKTPLPKDLIIYEMHVKGYTVHPSSGVPADKRGKYLGLLEGVNSDKVLGHLKKLGVNAVELLPIHEFDNKAAPTGINYWGYMTTHFFAPESSYASSPHGKQVIELKKLIDGLHKNGIAVILDVVYNHTAEGNELGPIFNFKGIDNKEYYRLYTNPEYYWNGTGCGNEFRSDSTLGRRYILESLMYWVKEYKVDGFRFDLATIIDKETMKQISEVLPKHVILIAEPWAADWNRNQWTKADFRNTRWAKWNDDFKKTVRNFVCGRPNRDNLMTVICGTCYWWAGKPTESVNFVECHDNDTMMDYCGNNPKIAMLAGLITLTSQGIPMLHEGQEFLKNKFGNDNSYDQDNEINHINWNLKEKNQKVVDFFSGLIKIRKTFPHFKYDRPLTEKDIRWILTENHNGLGYQLFGKDCDIIVLLNGDQNNWIRFLLPDDKDWTVLCNGTEVNLNGITTAKGDYNVPPITGVILMRKN